MWYIYSEMLFSHKKEGNPAIFNMDWSGGHYEKWNKSDGDRKILYHITYVKSKKIQTQRSRAEWFLPGVEERGAGMRS